MIEKTIKSLSDTEIMVIAEELSNKEVPFDYITKQLGENNTYTKLEILEVISLDLSKRLSDLNSRFHDLNQKLVSETES